MTCKTRGRAAQMGALTFKYALLRHASHHFLNSFHIHTSLGIGPGACIPTALSAHSHANWQIWNALRPELATRFAPPRAAWRVVVFVKVLECVCHESFHWR